MTFCVPDMPVLTCFFLLLCHFVRAKTLVVCIRGCWMLFSAWIGPSSAVHFFLLLLFMKFYLLFRVQILIVSVQLPRWKPSCTFGILVALVLAFFVGFSTLYLFSCLSVCVSIPVRAGMTLFLTINPSSVYNKLYIVNECIFFELYFDGGGDVLQFAGYILQNNLYTFFSSLF